MAYRDMILMECFDERKCFAKAMKSDGKQYCMRLVGKPYEPGKCPYCKEHIEDKGGEPCRK